MEGQKKETEKEESLGVGDVYVETSETVPKGTSKGEFLTGLQSKPRVVIGSNEQGELLSGRLEGKNSINPEVGGTILDTQAVYKMDHFSQKKIDKGIIKWAKDTRNMSPEEAESYLERVKKLLRIK